MTRRGVAAWLGVLVVALSALVGNNAFSLRDRLLQPAVPEAALPVSGRLTEAPTQETVSAGPTSLRSQPWWQEVGVVEGVGTTSTSPFTITDTAIQWRVTGSCRSGRLEVRAPGQPEPVAVSACPGESVGFGTRSGSMTLQVTADGPWRLEVAQQIDAPLVEPLLAPMTEPGAAMLAAGSFYDIDRTGVGRLNLYGHADGSYSLRLEDFFVTPNADLELRLSTVEVPRTSGEFMEAPSELIAVMDVTAGSFNHTVPAGIDVSRFRSIVVWCAPIQSAYAAASLRSTR